MIQGSSRWGAALAAAANLDENSPKDEVLAAPLDEAEGGDVPEACCAAVAQHHLVAVGEPEQVAQAGAQAAHHRLDRLLTVTGSEVGGGGLGQCLDLCGADLGRPAAEAPVGRFEPVGDADIGAVGGVRRARHV